MTASYLPLAQIVIGILLIFAILLQQRGHALGSTFGGGESGFYATRRGLQKKLFGATIVLGILFIVLALLNLVLR
ncbi:MAG: preprotein translocase subunit SecG [bacterium]